MYHHVSCTRKYHFKKTAFKYTNHNWNLQTRMDKAWQKKDYKVHIEGFLSINLMKHWKKDQKSENWQVHKTTVLCLQCLALRPHVYCTISPTAPPSSHPIPLWSPWPGWAPSAGQGGVPQDASWGAKSIFANSASPVRLAKIYRRSFISHGTSSVHLCVLCSTLCPSAEPLKSLKERERKRERTREA